ncbi:hypothetical protein [Patulibacter defluvii]|uniref:hypothetical protein n=1 Tax=Patulibacter defluvii TaxID=3095358 RepID=UPI002A748825|nr:hypothetical protein [Patulibacter sp. DM4]
MTRSREKPEVTAAKKDLYDDACALYERIKDEVRIPGDDGKERPYVAARFRQKVERDHAAGLIIKSVSQIINRRTTGFDRLEAAGRPDLFLEILVVNQNKPYHGLFSTTLVQIARDRLTAYLSSNPQVSDEALEAVSVALGTKQD